MKTRYTIQDQRSCEIKISRSRFICSLGPAVSVDDARAFVARVSAGHPRANHNCWAYIVGENGEVTHSSDNGEPSGSAGRPILGTLQSYDATNVAAVVTRYFGGTKLGIRGLIDAYSQAVKAALDLAPLTRAVPVRTAMITIDYAFNDTLVHRLKALDCRITDSIYTDRIAHTVDIELKDIPKAEALFLELNAEGKLDFSWTSS